MKSTFKDSMESIWTSQDYTSNYAYTKKYHNQVKAWNSFANITQNPSIKFGSITLSKNGQMDSPSNTLALGQTIFGHENNFSF